jgi:hypothetical protein
VGQLKRILWTETSRRKETKRLTDFRKSVSYSYTVGGGSPSWVPSTRRWWWWWRIWWNEDWQGKPKFLEKTCPSATLSTTNPTWPDPGRRGGKPATNRLSYGAAPRKNVTKYVSYFPIILCKCCSSAFKLVMTTSSTSFPFTSYNHHVILPMLHRHRSW